jgi:selenocysteine lyase/cysteine desulfurase
MLDPDARHWAMTSTRRAFLGAGLAGGAVLVGGCTASDDAAAPAAGGTASPSTEPSPSATDSAPVVPSGLEPVLPEFDPADWESVRAQFPLDPDKAQLAAFVLSPHTAQVDAAIAHHRARLGFDTEGVLLDGFEHEQRVLDSAASYAGGDARQYALTTSTTMGVATMYGGLDLAPDDEILTTTHDFYATEATLRLVRGRTGAKVSRVTLYDDPAAASVDEMVARLVRGITDRTRVVGLTWVHSSTGVRVPVTEIGAEIARVNGDRDRADRILFCVDGVHGFAAVDVDLPDLGCDVLATGTHKWLFGPRGTGILWARDWAPFTEIIPTFSGPDGGRRLTPGGYQDFEHRWSMDAAFGFHEQIGRDRVVARTVEQASRLKDELAGIDGVTVVTPASPDVSAGIVCLDVRGLTPGDGVYRLRDAGVVASATPYATSYLRLGPSIATSDDDVTAAIEAVASLV